MTGEFPLFVCQVAPFNQDSHRIREVVNFGRVRIGPYTNHAYITEYSKAISKHDKWTQILTVNRKVAVSTDIVT